MQIFKNCKENENHWNGSPKNILLIALIIIFFRPNCGMLKAIVSSNTGYFSYFSMFRRWSFERRERIKKQGKVLPWIILIKIFQTTICSRFSYPSHTDTHTQTHSFINIDVCLLYNAYVSIYIFNVMVMLNQLGSNFFRIFTMELIMRHTMFAKTTQLDVGSIMKLLP